MRWALRVRVVPGVMVVPVVTVRMVLMVLMAPRSMSMGSPVRLVVRGVTPVWVVSGVSGLVARPPTASVVWPAMAVTGVMVGVVSMGLMAR